MSKDRMIRGYEELRGAGSRRVVDAMRLLSEEMSDFDDGDKLSEMPAGALMKRRTEGGGMQMR